MKTTNRRNLLKAAGAGLALPFLPSLAWAGGGDAQAPPRRLLVLFWGNGVNPEHWSMEPGRDGRPMRLGRILEPLVPFADRLTFVEGLWNANTGGNIHIHAGQTGNLLTGAKLDREGRLRNARSVDRVIADHLGGDGLLRAFNVGCEVPTSHIDTYGYSTIYSSHLSWYDDITPVPLEIHPRRVYDAVVGARGPSHPEVLDRLGEDFAALRDDLAAEDRRSLEGYGDAVADLRRRITSLGPDENTLADESERGADRPEGGVPRDIREHQRLMRGLTVLALRSDRTRVATYLLNNDACNVHYHFLPTRKADYHEISHDPEHEDYAVLNEYVFARIADVLSAMQEVPEGDGTLLDHTTVLVTSSMITGDHDATRVPMIVVGDCGGAIRPGRVFDYGDRDDGDRKLCSFYLSLMRTFGIERERFGDADAPLEGFLDG